MSDEKASSAGYKLDTFGEPYSAFCTVCEAMVDVEQYLSAGWPVYSCPTCKGRELRDSIPATFQCPVCGAKDLLVTPEEGTYVAPYGPTVTYTINVVTCNVCKEGWQSDEADAIICAAVERANAEACDAMLATLAESHLTAPYIERVLALDPGSLRKRADGTYSKEAVAILRLVRANPKSVKESK